MINRLIDDFNYVLKEEERISNSEASSSFQNWVEYSGLLDVGFSSNRFTWSHGMTMESRKAARLDRALCCVEWRMLFSLETVCHLSHSHSDHCPLLLDLKSTRTRRLGERSFKFQVAWMRHGEFASLLEKEWVCDGDLSEALRGLFAKTLD